MYSILFCVCLLVLASRADLIPASRATWSGRTIQAPDGSVSFQWEGVQASVAFSNATALSVFIRSEDAVGVARFRVVVDGAVLPSAVVNVGGGFDQEVVLASGLSLAPHIVTLWSITDPIAMSWPVIQNGSTAVLHFDTDAGFFVASPALPQRRLRIIGDSIVCFCAN